MGYYTNYNGVVSFNDGSPETLRKVQELVESYGWTFEPPSILDGRITLVFGEESKCCDIDADLQRVWEEVGKPSMTGSIECSGEEPEDLWQIDATDKGVEVVMRKVVPDESTRRLLT